MSELEMLVLTTGLGGVAGINWYFFGPKGDGTVAADGDDGVQEAVVLVSGGYTPANVRVASGKPVRLIFDRQETSGCSEEIVFPDLGIRKFLPAFERTVVEVPAQGPGTLEFTCGMSMLRGRVMVE